MNTSLIKIITLFVLLLFGTSCDNDTKHIAETNCKCFEKIDLNENEFEFHFQMNKCFSQTSFLIFQNKNNEADEKFVNKVIDHISIECDHYNKLMNRYLESISQLKNQYYCTEIECQKVEKGVYKLLDSYEEQINYFIGDTLVEENLTTGIVIKSIKQKISPCMISAKPFYSNNKTVQNNILKSTSSVFTRILAVNGDTVIIEGIYKDEHTISRQLWIREIP